MSSSSTVPRRTRTAHDVRRINRSSVLHHLLIEGAMSRQELSGRSGLSAATVSNVIAEAIDDGLVVNSGQAASQGGRPGALFRMNADLGCVVGVAVAETFVYFEMYDASLVRVDSFMLRVNPDDNRPDQIVGNVVAGLESLLSRHSLDMHDVLGVGLSIPGLVEHRRGVAIFAPNWGWHHVPVVDMLRQSISAPIYIDNALKFFAIAESWFGLGRGVDNLVTLVVGTGVGAGIILNGRLFRGENNSAGEWGHTCVVLDGRPCQCGKRGCLETYIGAPGIAKTYAELSHDSVTAVDAARDDQQAFITWLVGAARDGDAIAAETLARTARLLGMGIANLINLFNPQRIILTGWCGQEIGIAYQEQIREAIQEHAMDYPAQVSELVVGDLKPESATRGAAILALERFLSGPDELGAWGPFA